MGVEEQNNELDEFLMVYMGIRLDSKGRKTYYWLPIDSTDEYNDAKGYDSSVVMAAVGGVYKFYSPKGENNKIYVEGVNAPRYSQRYHDADRIKLWAIADEEAKQRLNVKSVNRKSAKVEPLDDILSTIRDVSRSLTAAERRAFHSKISEAIFDR